MNLALSKLLMSELTTWDEKPRVISIGKMRFVYINSPENCQVSQITRKAASKKIPY